MKENGYFITLDLFASLDFNAHNNLVTRVTCTYYYNKRIIARGSASSARAHLCKTHEIVSQMVFMDIATNVEYSGTCVCLNPCIFPCM